MSVQASTPKKADASVNGQVGVLLAAVVMTVVDGAYWLDPAASIVISVFIAWQAVRLLGETADVLLESTPSGLDPEELTEAMAAVAGVESVHDLHVWQLTSGMDVATAHLVAADEQPEQAVLAAASAVLREQFNIEHATLQVESASGHGCQGADW